MSSPLVTDIQQAIQQSGGAITFARFMQLALYHPQWGYYCTQQFTDYFTTAPEISPLFAQCFAQQVQQIFTALPENNILELGAGTGQFAKSLLLELEKLNALPTRYCIKEISPTLRQQQQLLLQIHCPHLIERVTWLDQLPDSFVGVMMANEVLDALPVHLLQTTDSGTKELCITWENAKFSWCTRNPTNSLLAKYMALLQREYAFSPGYIAEINVVMVDLITALSQCLQQGVLFFVDYGYGQREYYHPDRRRGTLTCFHQHRHHDDPLLHVGEQDITAHVDFTRVAEAAVDAELTLAGYTTQAAFLLGCGLLTLAEEQAESMDIKAQYRQSQAIKQLILPSEMGERVKVMGLMKGGEISLMGFALGDRRRDL